MCVEERLESDSQTQVADSTVCVRAPAGGENVSLPSYT